MREHRYILEQYLKRKLVFNEVIHHKNGDRSDNRLMNLEIISRGIHGSIHRPKIPRKIIKCFYCKKSIKIRSKRYKYLKSKGQKHFYCSKVCLGKCVNNLKFKRLKIDSVIKQGLKKGWSGYKIAKVNGLNRRTVYNHLKDF